MLIYKIIRVLKSPRGTFGVLIDPENNPILCTVELPWKENKRDISCIPEGLYKGHVHMREEGTQNEYEVIMLEGVPWRTVIQLHRANTTNDLLGCIGTGTTFGNFGWRPAVLNSKIAHSKLMTRFIQHKDEVWFLVKDSCLHDDFREGTKDDGQGN